MRENPDQMELDLWAAQAEEASDWTEEMEAREEIERRLRETRPTKSSSGRGRGGDRGDRGEDPDEGFPGLEFAAPKTHKVIHQGFHFELPLKFQEIRPSQFDNALKVCEMFANGVDVVLVQAGTGFGKTLFAELVRQIFNWRMLYLPPHLQLQDQFLRDFVDARLIKGRTNYPHSGPNGKSDFRKGISCGDCQKKSLCGDGICAYTMAKRSFVKARTGVANTAYFLAAANYLNMFRPGKPPALDKAGRVRPSWSEDYLTVMDEADCLESVMLSFLKVEMSQKYLDEISELAGVSVPVPPVFKMDTWPDWLEKVKDMVELALKYLIRRDGSKTDIDSVRRIVRMDKFRLALNQVEPTWIYDPHKTLKNGRRTGAASRVILEPVKIGEMGKRLLWDYAGKAICMSGSIVSPDIFADETGLDKSGKRFAYIEVDSDWDPWRRPILRVPGVVVKKNPRNLPWTKQSIWDTLVEKILYILRRHPNERHLIHTVSHELARDLGAELQKHMAERIVIHEGDTKKREESLEKFQAVSNGVLVSASASRGVDLPGDMCRNVILAKVPWPNKGDRKIEQRMSLPNGWLWFRVQTVREILQQGGRGMRGPLDWCRIWIVDESIEQLIAHRNLWPKWWLKTIRQPGDYYLRALADTDRK